MPSHSTRTTHLCCRASSLHTRQKHGRASLRSVPSSRGFEATYSDELAAALSHVACYGLTCSCSLFSLSFQSPLTATQLSGSRTRSLLLRGEGSVRTRDTSHPNSIRPLIHKLNTGT